MVVELYDEESEKVITVLFEYFGLVLELVLPMDSLCQYSNYLTTVVFT